MFIVAEGLSLGKKGSLTCIMGSDRLVLHSSTLNSSWPAYLLKYKQFCVGCEDIIAEGLSLDNLVSILSWSSEPHGSQWVHNQALHFIREEFLQILHSSVLMELSREYLKEALSSDFLQVRSTLSSYTCNVKIQA